MITVKCQQCNTEFKAQRSSAKFCSAKCRVKYNSSNSIAIEDLDKPKVQEVVDFHESRTEEVIVHELATETVILAPVKENSYNVSKNEEKPLIGDANAKFDQLLKEFNKLIENAPKPKDIEVKLGSISEKAKNSNLTPRQVDAIVDRVRYYLNGQYKVSQLS